MAAKAGSAKAAAAVTAVITTGMGAIRTSGIIRAVAKAAAVAAKGDSSPRAATAKADRVAGLSSLRPSR